ncbi:sensor domain-containing diguanylate cyclase [Rummeliibacillus sp. JY-2-4R]
MRNLQILQNIKCQLLDLWIECAQKPLTTIDYLELFKGIILREFKIEHVDYLHFDNGMLYPSSTCNKEQYNTNGIPYITFAPYIEQRHQFPNTLVKMLKQFFDHAGDVLVLQEENEIMGLIVLEATPEWKEFAESLYIKKFEKLLSDTVIMIRCSRKNSYEKKLNRELYEMTEVFHSTMDINHILEEVIQGVKRIFPNFQSKLILSNDQDRRDIEDVYVFDYSMERPSTVEAFVSGEMTTELALDINYHLLNAPIYGKQGIYGILQIFVPFDYSLSSREKQFIQHLAHTSGNALENAKLYHQSHRLVSDLQLINETAQRLNMKLNREEILSFLTKQLNKSFVPAEICFALIDHNMFKNTTGTTEFFYEEEAKIYNDYIEHHFKNSVDPLFVAYFENLVNQKVTYNSLMAIPITINDRVQGYCAILHHDPYYFSFDSYKLMQSLIRHSSLAISNILLREQLQEMIDRDHLTNLYARIYLEQFVEKSMQDAEFGSLVLFDIDNFKKVNDTFGHQTGDNILKTVGKSLQQIVQNNGICARWGGEEMAIYLPNISVEDTVKLVNNIMTIIPQVTEPSVTMSSGIEIWNANSKLTYQGLLQHADIALYKAKNSGKNRYCLYQKILGNCNV